jgi:hypothetical protein
MRRIGAICLLLAMWSGVLLLLSTPAWAVPAFARRYGVTCSTCHSAWPALNATGVAFKLSGYRSLNGFDMKPTTADIDLAMGALTIPSIPPVSVTASSGLDLQRISRRAFDGTRASQTGSSIDLDNATLFIATPLGEHLSAFFEFPMFETHAPQHDFPNGPSGANDVGIGSKRDISFETESPTFEMGKMMWNSLLPTSIAPPNSLNLKLGVDELPLGFSAEANRLSVRDYLIYRVRALDLLSPVQTDSLPDTGSLLRLGEPQIQFAINGLIVPFGKPTDLAKPETFSLAYEVGITNGSNNSSDPNTEKDLFGHVGVRWWGQRLGFFGYYSPDIYNDAQRDDGSINNGFIMSGRQLANRFTAYGPDLTLSLEPWEIPVWLETQVLFNRESNPTAFNKSFSWWGGFTQLNGTIPVRAKFLQRITAYGRYEWLQGDAYDDTATCGATDAGPVCGVTGRVKPREWQAVGGLQWYVLENLKIVTEYSRREFNASQQRVTDSFFTVRAAIGF